ncbi:hypothetical protein C5167_012581 [Papaver somniferum]|uniref:Uncharacterized protein n=1 Tax=Papaver somniferum TaxID=3469 RepID=A0A4Y7J263_PAPSO|nr:hypothetical protein C5167_012581 [Papaver somniferum]
MLFAIGILDDVCKELLQSHLETIEGRSSASALAGSGRQREHKNRQTETVTLPHHRQNLSRAE